MINNVQIDNVTLSLLTKTKEIAENYYQEDNLIVYEGYTNRIDILVNKDRDIEADIKIEAGNNSIYIYNKEELISIATPIITDKDKEIIRYNVSYENNIMSIELHEEMEVNAEISFAIMSDNKIFHIGSIKETEYWFNNTTKEIYTVREGQKNVIVKDTKLSNIPYLAPRVLGGNKIFYAEQTGGIYSINSDKTLSLESEVEYKYLTALPNNLFIGVKQSNEGFSITYDIVTYNNATGFTIHDSYTINHNGYAYEYNSLPIATITDSYGKNLNICFINSYMYDLDPNAYYSATIDITNLNPKFNFTKSLSGRAIVKESGPGPMVYYNVSRGRLFIGSIDTQIAAIHPVYAQTDYFTALATATVYSQVNKALIAFNIDERRMPTKYLHSSIQGTAYTVTISNKEATHYDIIDISIPKIIQPINQDNVYLLDNSTWDYNYETGEDNLYVMPRTIFKGPTGLYSKRILFFSYDNFENSGINVGTFTSKTDKQQHYRNFKTTDDIIWDVKDAYSVILSPKENVFISEKVETLPVTTFIDTDRTVKKTMAITSKVDTQRTVVNQLKAFRIRIRRHIVSSSILTINNILRKITKSKLCKPKTSRLIISSSLKTIRAKRKTCIKVNKRIYTNRKVDPGYEPITIWLDTKLTTLNTIKSKGPLLRKTSNDAQTTVPNTLRPIVYVYKLNDGHPIDLDTIRTVHKSTEPKINTLRRINYHFTYDTTAHVSRIISNTSLTSIKSIRKNICSVHNGHKSIRRVSKDNCICCNVLTNRKVINDFSTAFNTNRAVIKKHYSTATLDTNRLTAIKYMSGYAFTKRCITSKDINSIDLYRYITNITNPELDSLRKITVYDWFYNPTTRHITNEANRSYLTSRKAVSNIFVSQDTSRSICNKIELNLDNNREIIKSIDRDIDAKRNVAGEVSKEIDVTKKVVEKYIYLNKGQRQIIKSIEQDIDSYREINKLLIANIDTIREVKSENITDTLCIDFIFKHGSLWEAERYFYKA